MTEFLIHQLQIKDLWGYREFDLTFKRDVNIIIGPNASGKTTILNLLRYVLTADLINLDDIEFSKITIKLHSFEKRYRRNVSVQRTKNGYKYFISQKPFDIDTSTIPRSYLQSAPKKYRPSRAYRVFSEIRKLTHDLRENLDVLVPAVWLPVSRRLPITEEEDEELEFDRSGFVRLESVDVRLRTLLRELVRYRLGLESQLSERYKEFERRVLQMILFSKEHDQLSSLHQVAVPSQEEKEQLIRAFEVAGLLDNQMKRRIEEHFSTSAEAVERLKKWFRDEEDLEIEDLLIVPLIGRTESSVRFARDLEEFRVNLFEPLHNYESIVNSFLNGKQVRVEEDGELSIKSLQIMQEIGIHQLSSGEKQILILLTQALLWENKPIVYVADEPELSLHVSWQEKLLLSLLELGGQIQIIVATHSPDIVGPFVDNIIELDTRSDSIY